MNTNKPKVILMGLGYIGLPTAALLASKGVYVHGVDINPRIVSMINQGEIHIVEPDLEGLVKYDIEKGLLKAHTEAAEGDVFVIAVPTPFKGDHEPDISYVLSATDMFLPFLKEGNLIILESTSPVGTTEKVAAHIFEKRPDLKNKIHIAYCPERVLPGRVIFELENNDRVIGGIDQASSEKAANFYRLFVKGNLHLSNSKTAEMCKLVENAYRDVNIAFANELSMICEKANINVWELIALASKHPRVNILQPGTGVGGHCIAVDPWFIVHDFKEEARLIENARLVNLKKTHWVTNRIIETAKSKEKESGKKPVIACLGLAYKPDIDDLRESPSVEIARELISKGYEVVVAEPNIETHAEFRLLDHDTCLQQADVAAVLVSHREFKQLQNPRDVAMLDFCGIYQ